MRAISSYPYSIIYILIFSLWFGVEKSQSATQDPGASVYTMKEPGWQVEGGAESIVQGTNNWAKKYNRKQPVGSRVVEWRQFNYYFYDFKNENYLYLKIWTAGEINKRHVSSLIRETISITSPSIPLFLTNNNFYFYFYFLLSIYYYHTQVAFS